MTRRPNIWLEIAAAHAPHIEENKRMAPIEAERERELIQAAHREIAERRQEEARRQYRREAIARREANNAA